MTDLVFLEPNKIDAVPFTTSEVVSTPNQHIYVVERGENDVKIGVSTEPKRRIRTIETQGGFEAKRHFVGESVSNGYAVESFVHAKLAGHRKIGEWFCVSYERAVSVVRSSIDQVGEAITKKHKIPNILAVLPTAMDDLKELDPVLYLWCVKNGYEIEYTNRGICAYGDFGDGIRDEIPFELFRSITYAILEGRLK